MLKLSPRLTGLVPYSLSQGQQDQASVSRPNTHYHRKFQHLS